MITLDILRAICPTTPRRRLKEALPGLVEAAERFEITTSSRVAHWLAQLAHESGGFVYVREIASGEAYEGRTDLGNVRPGDGRRYRGRGWISITGRDNARAAGLALGLPLEEQPELMERPDVAGGVSGWFWATHGCNELADRGAFRAITRRINGGLNGLASRWRYYAAARDALGC